MNKRNRTQVLSLVPSLTAHHTSYKGYHITRYPEPEGYKYVTSTLTGNTLHVDRSLKSTRKWIDNYNSTEG